MSSASYSLTVRFPSGTEFWHTEKPPDVGSTMSHYGRQYLILSCEQLSRHAFALRVAEKKTSEGFEPAVA